MATILITGASGRIGRQVSAHLVDHHALTLVDLSFEEFPKDILKKAKTIETDLTKEDNWKGLLNGIEYVIQFAADPSPKAGFYESLLDLNIELPYNLFNSALEAPSLKRILFASSIHTVDAYPHDVQVRPGDPVRPNDLYGVTKVYLEGLASYYAYTHGIQSIGMRIGDYKSDTSELPRRAGPQGLSTYLSARDFNHFIDCCLSAKVDEPFLLLNALSHNTFNRLEIESAKKLIGYSPTDNAFDTESFQAHK